MKKYGTKNKLSFFNPFRKKDITKRKIVFAIAQNGSESIIKHKKLNAGAKIYKTNFNKINRQKTAHQVKKMRETFGIVMNYDTFIDQL